MAQRDADQLADRFRRRQIRVMRFQSGEADRAVRAVRGVTAELVTLLVRNDPTELTRPTARLARVGDLADEAQRLVRQRFAAIDRQVERDGQAAARVDQSVTAEIVETGNVDRGLRVVPPRQHAAIFKTAVVEGSPAAEFWKQQAQSVTNEFRRRVGIGVTNGEGVAEIARRVRGTRRQQFRDGIITQQRERQVEMLVRAAVQTNINSLRNAQFKRNEDLIRGQQVIVTFDSRLCPICAAIAGAIVDLDGNQLPESPIQTPLPSPNAPFHIGCRCFMAPVLRGEPAAADAELDDWLREQPESVQAEVLGTQRAALWRERKIRAEDFIDQRGRPLTVDQLREVA